MRPFRAIIKELTRPRGHKGHRFYRIQRSSRAGIALLLVMTSLMFMTVLMAEIGYAATVRLQLAAHQRDEAAAEGLAMTGVQIYRLILVASKQMGSDSNMIGQALAGMGINAGDMLWQMLPYINTGLMRMIFVSGGSVDEGDVEDVKEQGGLSEAQIAESRESVGRDKNFLDFDGDFFAEVVDEDRKINVTGITATTYSDLLADQNAIELYSLTLEETKAGIKEEWTLSPNIVQAQNGGFASSEQLAPYVEFGIPLFAEAQQTLNNITGILKITLPTFTWTYTPITLARSPRGDPSVAKPFLRSQREGLAAGTSRVAEGTWP